MILNDPNKFNNLPSEIICTIFEGLSFADRLTCTLVCHRFLNLVCCPLSGTVAITIKEDSTGVLSPFLLNCISRWAPVLRHLRVDISLLQGLDQGTLQQLTLACSNANQLVTVEFGVLKEGCGGKVVLEDTHNIRALTWVLAKYCRSLLFDCWFFFPQPQAKSLFLVTAQQCTNLTSLTLSSSINILRLINTNTLSRFANLTDLSVCGGHVDQYSLQRLPHLKRFTLLNPLEGDLLALDNCQSLESVKIKTNRYRPRGLGKEIEVLTTCKVLSSIEVVARHYPSRNGLVLPPPTLVANLNFLFSLPKLTSVSIGPFTQSEPFDVQIPFSVLSNLTYLAIIGTMQVLNSLSFLSGCLSLKSFQLGNLDWFYAQDLIGTGGLESCPNLTHLALHNCRVHFKDDDIARCEGIATLSMIQCQIVQLVKKVSFPSLVVMEVRDTKALDLWLRPWRIEALQHLSIEAGTSGFICTSPLLLSCPSLKTLSIKNQAYIPDEYSTGYSFLTSSKIPLPCLSKIVLENLKGICSNDLALYLPFCPNLRELSVKDCQNLRDLSIVSRFAQLRSFTASRCDWLCDISALKNCISLENIYLDHLYSCSDITSLVSLPCLKLVVLEALPNAYTGVWGLSDNQVPLIRVVN